MQEVAISMLSESSGVRVPSFREVERKSIMARARRFLVSRVDAWRRVLVGKSGSEAGCAYHDGAKRFWSILQVLFLIHRVYERLYVVEVWSL